MQGDDHPPLCATMGEPYHQRRGRLNGQKYRSIVAAILTVAKFLPNITYPTETVATEFQQMLEAVRKIAPSPNRAAVPPDAAPAN